MDELIDISGQNLQDVTNQNMAGVSGLKERLTKKVENETKEPEPEQASQEEELQPEQPAEQETEQPQEADDPKIIYSCQKCTHTFDKPLTTGKKPQCPKCLSTDIVKGEIPF